MTPQPIDPLRMRIFSELNLHLAPHNIGKESMQIASSTLLSPSFTPNSLHIASHAKYETLTTPQSTSPS